MKERPSARLILLDPQDRLFLFNVHDPKVFDPANPFFDPFWVMIGGMVDPGEEFAAAAVREAGEETKLPVIGEPVWVWTRERRMSWRGTRSAKFDETPEIFWTIKILPSKKALRLTVRGTPETFEQTSGIDLKLDKFGYSAFHITRVAQIPGALTLLKQARKTWNSSCPP